MYAQVTSLGAILKRHAIHPKFHEEFRALVEEGRRPGAELRTRLDHVTNYQAALDEVMAGLSAPLTDQFPPDHFESLDLTEFTNV